MHRIGKQKIENKMVLVIQKKEFSVSLIYLIKQKGLIYN